jgi:hypothetical protein
LAQERDRIAAGMNEIVVRRLFAAGLYLHTALGLMDGHRAAGKVQEVIGELDLAITDFRDVLFDHHQPGSAPRRVAGPGLIGYRQPRRGRHHADFLHLAVPQFLAPYGGAGTDSDADLWRPSTLRMTAAYATAKTGDVFLCHPFTVHTATWPHRGAGPR